MELKVTDADAVEVSEKIFNAEFNEALIHQVLVAFMAGSRQGTKAQKNRSDVKGGGKKPWRQKGTGRARAGTIRSPIWRSGGRAFAARPQDHSQKVNKKMYRGAMRSIFSKLVADQRLVIVKNIDIKEPKTKLLLGKLKEMNIDTGLIISNEVDVNLFLSSRNIPHVCVCDADSLDPYNLISHEKVVITVDALKKVEEKLV